MHNGVTPAFDLATHQRKRLRTLERENRHLREHRRRLEQILALTLRIAAGQDCEPRKLLEVIYEIERGANDTDRLVQVLRDTDPERIKTRAR